MELIIALTSENIIGKNGKLPWNIPLEMKLFKDIT